MSTLNGKRIELWVEARDGLPAVSTMMRTLLDELAAVGAAVTVVVPEDEVTGMGRASAPSDPDLVLLKTATSLGLSRAMAAEQGGQPFLNTARASWRASDKAAVVAKLAAARLPISVTYLTVPGTATSSLPSERTGAWISKPVYGVHGIGVSFHETFPRTLPVEAASPSFIVDDGTRLVQRRIGRDEEDVKVYVAGGRCFAGRKRFTADSYRADEIEAIDLPRSWEDIALAGGSTLGLRCFGVDLRVRDAEAVIVDVNPFPGYRGFPGAVAALRADISAALVGRRT